MRSETNVVDLRQWRIERLADDLARHLRDGHVIVEVDRIADGSRGRAGLDRLVLTR